MTCSLRLRKLRQKPRQVEEGVERLRWYPKDSVLPGGVLLACHRARQGVVSGRGDTLHATWHRNREGAWCMLYAGRREERFGRQEAVSPRVPGG